MVKILPNCSGLTFEEESTSDFDLNAMLAERQGHNDKRYMGPKLAQSNLCT